MPGPGAFARRRGHFVVGWIEGKWSVGPVGAQEDRERACRRRRHPRAPSSPQVGEHGRELVVGKELAAARAQPGNRVACREGPLDKLPELGQRRRLDDVVAGA